MEIKEFTMPPTLAECDQQMREIVALNVKNLWEPGNYIFQLGEELIHLQNCRVFGAIDTSGSVRGAASYRLIERSKEAILPSLCVDRRSRNQGIGSMLLTHVVSLAEADCAEIISVSSLIDAVPFYAKHGFVPENPFSERRLFLPLKLSA